MSPAASRVQCGSHHPARPDPEDTPMGERDRQLEAAGYPLDRGPKEGPVIDLLSILGDTLYASGQVPYDAGVLTSKGKVPSQVSVEDATKAAALCAANILRAICLKLGSLDRIERVVRPLRSVVSTSWLRES